MTTRATIERYFADLQTGAVWQDHLADQVEFTNFATPVAHVTGRDAYIDAVEGFYAMADTIEVEEMLVDGDRACVHSRYQLRPPVGEPFTSHVAEVFEVAQNTIQSLTIFFDSAPYPTPPPAEQ